MARGQSEPLFEGMVIRERVHHGPSEERWTCTDHSIERPLREALRNPFPGAPVAAGPAVWNREEAAEGISAGWVSGPGE